MDDLQQRLLQMYLKIKENFATHEEAPANFIEHSQISIDYGYTTFPNL